MLLPHIAKIWIFEKAQGFLPEDIKTIVPNGMMKVVFPYRGSLFSSIGGGSVQENPEASLWVVGMTAMPAIVDAPGALGMVGIEIQPGSAYHFFPFSLKEAIDRVHAAGDIWGKKGLVLQDRLAGESSPEGRVRLAQDFLLRMLMDRQMSDPIVDYAVPLIRARHGLITVRELAERLGYSRRYLDMKFTDLVGVGPKALSRIVRFQQAFGALARQGIRPAKGEFLDTYFDQAHFIKEFKRFSGLPPAAYTRARNDFLYLYQRGISHSYNPE